MPGSQFNEESFFFLQVKDVCRNAAFTCAPDCSIVDAARLMHKENVAGLIVTEDNQPVGILSVGDLRDAIAVAGEDLSKIQVRDVMHQGITTVRHIAYVFEAIFKMAKNNIHRLAVVDEEQQLIGMINATDLLSQQTMSPLYLTREIGAAAPVVVAGKGPGGWRPEQLLHRRVLSRSS